MNLKPLLFLLLCGFPSFAQAPASLQTATRDLYVAFDDIDIDVLTSTICGNKETLYNQLDAYFLNDEQKFRYVLHSIKYNYAPVKMIDGKSYYGISFRNIVRITYFKPLQSVAETQQALKTKFNAESVTYEKARNSFMVIYTAKMVAYNEPGNTMWKFFFTDNTLPNDISKPCLEDPNVRKELGIN